MGVTGTVSPFSAVVRGGGRAPVGEIRDPGRQAARFPSMDIRELMGSGRSGSRKYQYR